MQVLEAGKECRSLVKGIARFAPSFDVSYVIRLYGRLVGVLFASAIVIRCYGLALTEGKLPQSVMFWAFSLSNIHLLDNVGITTEIQSTTSKVSRDAPAWLFRTGAPAVSSLFAVVLDKKPIIDPEVLRQHMRKVVPTMPADFELVDVCLLGGPTLEREDYMVEVEEGFFARNPDQGEFHQMPMPGLLNYSMESACNAVGVSSDRCPSNTRQPRDLVSADRQKLAQAFPEWDPNGLATRVEQLHQLLHGTGRSSRPRAVFFHCQCGCDRTGMLAAAYQMTYHGVGFQKVMGQNVQIAGRPMYYRDQVGLQWYCEHLRATGRYEMDDCGDCDQPGMLCTEQTITPDRWYVRLVDNVVAVLALAFSLTGTALLFRQEGGLPSVRRRPGDEQTVATPRAGSPELPTSPPERSTNFKMLPWPCTPETPDPPPLLGPSPVTEPVPKLSSREAATALSQPLLA